MCTKFYQNRLGCVSCVSVGCVEDMTKHFGVLFRFTVYKAVFAKVAKSSHPTCKRVRRSPSFVGRPHQILSLCRTVVSN